MNLLHNQTRTNTTQLFKPWKDTNSLQQPRIIQQISWPYFPNRERWDYQDKAWARQQFVTKDRIMSLKCMGCNSRNSSTNLLEFSEKYLLGLAHLSMMVDLEAHKEKLEFLPSNSHGNKQRRKLKIVTKISILISTAINQQPQMPAPGIAPSAGSGKVIRPSCKQGIWRAGQS